MASRTTTTAQPAEEKREQAVKRKQVECARRLECKATEMSAKGATEEEAKRNLLRKMLAECDKTLDASKVGCDGRPCKKGECTLAVDYKTTDVVCMPIEFKQSKDGLGFACYWSGKMFAVCRCLES